jgi:hypothetical protein
LNIAVVSLGITILPSLLILEKKKIILQRLKGGLLAEEFIRANRLKKRCTGKLKRKLGLKLSLIGLLKRTRGFFPSGMT